MRSIIEVIDELAGSYEISRIEIARMGHIADSLYMQVHELMHLAEAKLIPVYVTSENKTLVRESDVVAFLKTNRVPQSPFTWMEASDD